MMVLQTSLILSATLLLCSGARLPRQLSLEDKMKRLPDLNTCGLSDVLRTSVFDAILAKPKELPWFVFLGYVKIGRTDEIKWLCGGSLVTNQHVLTAADCVHPDSIYTDRHYNFHQASRMVNMSKVKLFADAMLLCGEGSRVRRSCFTALNQDLGVERASAVQQLLYQCAGFL